MEITLEYSNILCVHIIIFIYLNLYTYIQFTKTTISIKNVYKVARSSYLTDANYQNQHASAIAENSGVKPDPDFWMDRLNQLRAKANLAPHRNADGSILTNSHLMMMDNKVMDENVSLNTMNAQKVSLIRRDVSNQSHIYIFIITLHECAIFFFFFTDTEARNVSQSSTTYSSQVGPDKKGKSYLDL